MFDDINLFIEGGDVRVEYLRTEPRQTRPRPHCPYYPEVYKHSRTKKPRGVWRKYYRAMDVYRREWEIWIAEQSDWWLHRNYMGEQPIGPIAEDYRITAASFHAYIKAVTCDEL